MFLFATIRKRIFSNLQPVANCGMKISYEHSAECRLGLSIAYDHLCYCILTSGWLLWKLRSDWDPLTLWSMYLPNRIKNGGRQLNVSTKAVRRRRGPATRMLRFIRMPSLAFFKRDVYEVELYLWPSGHMQYYART